VRRAFPFRIDMRAIQCSRELTIVQNPWGISPGWKIPPHMFSSISSTTFDHQ
jgi:hypothetical protein